MKAERLSLIGNGQCRERCAQDGSFAEHNEKLAF